jgi:hypothetical protein
MRFVDRSVHATTFLVSRACATTAMVTDLRDAPPAL